MSGSRLIGTAATVLVLVVGCGAGTTSSPTPPGATTVSSTAAAGSSSVRSPLPSATPAGSSAPSPAPLPSAAPTIRPSIDPSEFHDDPLLETQIPVQIDGSPVHVQTILATSLLLVYPAESASHHQLSRFLTETGADPAGITIALATGRVGEADISFQAIRAPGATAIHLLAAAVYLARTDTPDPAAVTIATTQLAGKTVTMVTPNDESSDPIWVYPKGETVYLGSGSAATAATILAALPF